MDSGSIRAAFLEFCTVGRTIQREEVELLGRLGEVLKANVKARVSTFLQRHAGQPVLYSYQSDATSGLVFSSVVQHSYGKKVARSGKTLIEFLVQRALYKARSPSGQVFVEELYRDPVPLHDGKGAWPLFTAGCQFAPLLRQAGHQGICLTHVIFDRAVQAPLARNFERRTEGYYVTGVGPDLGPDCKEKWWTDLCVANGCACHDISNSFKWALNPFIQENLLKDLYIVVESLRNSFTILQASMRKFLIKYLSFRPEGATTGAAAAWFWQVMGVEVDMMEAVLEVSPWWEGERLWVNSELANDRGNLGKITTVLQYLFKWRKFTETRFLSVGSSCRGVVASLAVGLSALVEIARATPGCTDYHISGFGRLSPAVLEYMVVAAVSSWAPDSLMAEVMEDDRLLKRVASLKEIFATEIVWLDSLPLPVWEMLSSIAGPAQSHSVLRHKVLTAVHVSAAYIDRKLFQVLGALPWRLAVGDIVANLRELAGMDGDGLDSCSAKLRQLQQMGYSEALLVDAVTLLGEVPWSTLLVEQGHGSTAASHRLRPTYAIDMLAKRALLHQCRHLFFPSLYDKAQQKLNTKREVLQRRNPKKSSGQTAYLGWLCLVAREKVAEEGKSILPRWMVQDLVRQHSSRFKDLPPLLQEHFEEEAAALARYRQLSLDEEVLDTMQSLDLLHARHLEELCTVGPRNVCGAVRFGEQDFVAMAELLAQADFSGASARALRELAMRSPAPPPVQVRAQFEAVVLPGATAQRKMPPWLPGVCINRNWFQGTAFLADEAEGSKAFLFLYATQQPYAASFLAMEKVEKVFPYLDASEPEVLPGVLSQLYQRYFSFKLGDTVPESAVHFPEGAEVKVVDCCFFLHSGTIATDMDPEPLSELLQRLPAKAQATKAQESKRPSTKGAHLEGLLDDMPWLDEYISSSRVPGGQPSSSASVQRPEPLGGNALGPQDVPEDEAVALWEHLHLKRKELEIERPLTLVDFTLEIRGACGLNPRRAPAQIAP